MKTCGVVQMVFEGEKTVDFEGGKSPPRRNLGQPLKFSTMPPDGINFDSRAKMPEKAPSLI